MPPTAPAEAPATGPRVPPRRPWSRLRGARVATGGLALALAALAGCGREAAVGGAGRRVEGPPGRGLTQIVVSGTPYEMGVHQGRLLRDAVRARVARALPDEVAGVAAGYARPVRDLLPVGAWDELRGIAEGAGVSVDDLFDRERAREIQRWHAPATEPGLASFASAPGEAPCLAVALPWAASAVGAAFGRGAAGASAWDELVVVERHPAGGTATLVIAAPGSVGGIAGVSARGVVAAFGEDPSRSPEQRSLRGAPFPVGFRYALERGADADAVVAALPRTLGHRVVVADAANRRVDVLLALAGEDPVASPAQAWVLRPAGGPDPKTDPATAANVEAQDRKLASYSARPGCADAADLAEAGMPPSPVAGAVVVLSPAGCSILLDAQEPATHTFAK
ncbi:MAG: hypothetical protein JNM10_09610 [Planctomycetia bacterium]|nr:hypothetical protein [Planctomycetia bacterium]